MGSFDAAPRRARAATPGPRPRPALPRRRPAPTQKPDWGSASPVSISLVRPDEVTSGMSPINTIPSAITARAAAAHAGWRCRVQPASRVPAAITPPITPSAQECWSAPDWIEPAALDVAPPGVTIR